MGISTMFLRSLLTTAFVVVGLAAVLIADCTTALIDLIDDDLSSVCATVSFLGSEYGLWAGLGLSGFAGLGVVATWTPYLRAKLRQRKFEPGRALVENLGRLADVGSQLTDVDEDSTFADIEVARYVRRVEAVETSMMTDGVPSREVTQQWMRLLREGNDLHNEGTLSTADFKEMNTRLLDLFFSPQDDTDQLSGASSG